MHIEGANSFLVRVDRYREGGGGVKKEKSDVAFHECTSLPKLLWLGYFSLVQIYLKLGKGFPLRSDCSVTL